MNWFKHPETVPTLAPVTSNATPSTAIEIAVDEAAVKSELTKSANPANTPAAVADTPPSSRKKQSEFENLRAKFKATLKEILDGLTPAKADKQIVKCEISAIKSFRKRLIALLAVGIKPDAIFAAMTKKGFLISREQFAETIGELVGAGESKKDGEQNA